MVVRRLTPMECISIHAPARGGDLLTVRKMYDRLIISIHAPARGGDGHPAGP